jgi:hypothetical protein
VAAKSQDFFVVTLDFYPILLYNVDIAKIKKYNKNRFFGGFADEKTPLRRAVRVRTPRGAAKIEDFGKRR